MLRSKHPKLMRQFAFSLIRALTFSPPLKYRLSTRETHAGIARQIPPNRLAGIRIAQPYSVGGLPQGKNGVVVLDCHCAYVHIVVPFSSADLAD
jgi:hypothetical protein